MNEHIIKEEKEINEELFKNYFNFQKPTEMLKYLHDLNDKTKNNLLVNTVNSGLVDLKSEIKKMSEDEIKTEKPCKILDIVEKSLTLMKKKDNKLLMILNYFE